MTSIPKSILTPIHHEADMPALEAALAIAQSTGGAITALHVRPHYDRLRSAFYPMSDLAEDSKSAKLKESAAKHAGALKALVIDRCTENAVSVHFETDEVAGKNSSAHWRDQEGLFPQDIVRIAASFDLIVVTTHEKHALRQADLIEALASGSGRPVLVAPRRQNDIDAKRITIAWNGSAESARAVTAAMGLIMRADAVEIVTVDNADISASAPNEVARNLARHGVDAKVSIVPRPDGATAESVLMSALEAAKPGLVVMGCYSHSRLREAVFGGMTRTVFKSGVPFAAFVSR